MSFRSPFYLSINAPGRVAEGNPIHWTSVWGAFDCMPMGKSKTSATRDHFNPCPLRAWKEDSNEWGENRDLSFAVISSFSRYIWTETGRHCPIWKEIWEPAGAHAGGAVRGLHPTAGAEGRGPFPAAWPGQPRQGASGCIRLWREALLWQVQGQVMAWLTIPQETGQRDAMAECLTIDGVDMQRVDYEFDSTVLDYFY